MFKGSLTTFVGYLCGYVHSKYFKYQHHMKHLRHTMKEARMHAFIRAVPVKGIAAPTSM